MIAFAWVSSVAYYRPLTQFDPPLTHFDQPIISSISNEFALSERYVVFLFTNLQITAENSHYLMFKIFM